MIFSIWFETVPYVLTSPSEQASDGRASARHVTRPSRQTGEEPDGSGEKAMGPAAAEPVTVDDAAFKAISRFPSLQPGVSLSVGLILPAPTI